MIIEVARLGERLVRDDRVTTHAALVSRAFGASRIYMSEASEDIQETVTGVNRTWGGSFEVVLEENLRGVIRSKKAGSYGVVHLTMYGQDLNEALPPIRRLDRVLVVIGASKVPREIYELADYNVAVGSPAPLGGGRPGRLPGPPAGGWPARPGLSGGRPEDSPQPARQERDTARSGQTRNN